MARIHGLLYLRGGTLSVDDIMDRLAISRGNVSMSLNKLIDWGLVYRVHKKEDRKDHFSSITDLWEMFTLVAHQRKRREVDPITWRRSAAPQGTASPPRRSATLAEDDQVQDRFRKINDLWKLLSLVDSLASKFFESHHGIRDAIEILSQDEEADA